MIGIHATTATFHDVQKVKLVRPEKAGGQWKGVPHSELTLAVCKSVEKITKEHSYLNKGQFILSRDGADFTGSIPIGPHEGGVQPCIGFAASNDCRKALEFYVGAMVGDTCLVSYAYGGLVRFPSWEYVEGFKLSDVTDEAVEVWKQMRYTIWENLGVLEEMGLSDNDMRAILMECAVREYTSWSSLGNILKWYNNRQGNTGLSLLEAFSMNWSCRRPLYRLDVLHKVQELILEMGKVTA